jgi:putative chitinase
MLTLEQLVKAFPKAKESRLEELMSGFEETFQLFDINTPKRQAAFLAQTAHESGNFNFMVENLNYSAEALDRVFPKYFKNAGRDAQEYHRQPEKIANVVYANRMGNGDEASGDGFRFRGRGLIQVTGRTNYSLCGEALGADLIAEPELLETPAGACLSAGWYWGTNGLNELADAEDIKAMTKRINGGYIGLEDRIEHYEHAMAVLVE